MKVSIYSIQETLFEGEAEKLIANTSLGQITVLNDHLPLISDLKGPVVEIVDKENNKNMININSGFIEVKPNSEVVVLLGEGVNTYAVK